MSKPEELAYVDLSQGEDFQELKLSKPLPSQGSGGSKEKILSRSVVCGGLHCRYRDEEHSEAEALMCQLPHPGTRQTGQSRAWWYAIPAQGRLRQEDSFEFVISLDSLANTRTARNT